MTARRPWRLLRAALFLSAGLAALGLLGLELAYRLALRSLEPLPALADPARLPPRVAAALWAVEVQGKPGPFRASTLGTSIATSRTAPG
jgi:hypothetical protein